MEEQLREKYFLVVRVGLLLIIQSYIVISKAVFAGAPVWVLLLLASFIGVWTIGEWINPAKYRYVWGILAVMEIVLYMKIGKEFILLGVYLLDELLFHIKTRAIWYGMSFVAALLPAPDGIGIQLMVTIFLAVIYVQNNFIVEPYKKQMQQDMEQEQHLKQNIYRRESSLQEERKRAILQVENKLLEERETLSQTLHDKLGHSINGSIYQLEAAKILVEKEPQTSVKMLRMVTDQLRIGMDEIRSILRNGRPPRYKLTILQLEKLCEECRAKGMEAILSTEGNLEQVPPKHLEIILDNAYEAVSNSLKYSKCTRIDINLIVMNRMVRCMISDNGVGCREINDGMGIVGMRRRMREINGIIDFTAEAGFAINMLMPLPERMGTDVWKK